MGEGGEGGRGGNFDKIKQQLAAHNRTVRERPTHVCRAYIFSKFARDAPRGEGGDARSHGDESTPFHEIIRSQRDRNLLTKPDYLKPESSHRGGYGFKADIHIYTSIHH